MAHDGEKEPRDFRVPSLSLVAPIAPLSAALLDENQAVRGAVKAVFASHPFQRNIDGLPMAARMVWTGFNPQVSDCEMEGGQILAMDLKRLMFFVHEQRKKLESFQLAQFIQRRMTKVRVLMGEEADSSLEKYEEFLKLFSELESQISSRGMAAIFARNVRGEILYSTFFQEFIKKYVAFQGVNVQSELRELVRMMKEQREQEGLIVTRGAIAEDIVNYMATYAHTENFLQQEAEEVRVLFEGKQMLQDFIKSMVFDRAPSQDTELLSRIFEKTERVLGNVGTFFHFEALQQAAAQILGTPISFGNARCSVAAVNRLLLQGSYLELQKKFLIVAV